MTAFFPFPVNIGNLHTRNGLNTARWHEIAAEREHHRVVALAWRDAAVRDGWSIKPTYASEGIDSSCSLSREPGFKVQILSRPSKIYDADFRGGSLGGGEVNAWGPDRLSIPTPVEYPGFHYFLDALVTCKHCRRGPNCGFFDPPGQSFHPVATKAYSFAGRACEECLPSLKAVHERPGWND